MNRRNFRFRALIPVFLMALSASAQPASDASLMAAVADGKRDEVKLLLDRGAHIEAADDSGWTPLIFAAIDRKADMVKLLLDRGAKIDAKDGKGLTALIFAAAYSQLDIVKLLLDRGAKIETKTGNGNTALLAAAAGSYPFGADSGDASEIDRLRDEGFFLEGVVVNNGRTEIPAGPRDDNVDTVKLLLDRGAAIEAKNDEGLTPLTLAAFTGKAEVVKLLLEHGADKNVKDDHGQTALDWAKKMRDTHTDGATPRGVDYAAAAEFLESGAAETSGTPSRNESLIDTAAHGKTSLVGFMLDRGTNIETRNNKGWTALIAAAYSGEAETVKFLLDRGADINAKTNKGTTALIFAADQGRIDVIKLLLDRKADLEAKDNSGSTALKIGARVGKADVVKLLLERGADVKAVDAADGAALLSASALGNNVDALKNMSQKGVDLNSRTADGKTALMVAAQSGSRAAAAFLLDHGADVNAQDKLGETALMKACDDGSGELFKLLSQRGAAVSIKNLKGETVMERCSWRRDRIKSSACKEAPAEQFVDNSELVARTDTIVVAYVGDNSKFSTTGVMKGAAPQEFTVDGAVLEDQPADISRMTYRNHADPIFWMHGGGAGGAYRQADCQIHPGFSAGGTYLIFLGKPYHNRSFELLDGDRWESDKWFNAVAGLIKIQEKKNAKK